MSAEAPGVRGRSRARRRFIDSVRSDLEVRGLRLDEQVIALEQDRERDGLSLNDYDKDLTPIGT